MKPPTLRFLSRKQIDASLWDACVSESYFPLPYALSWYLDIVAVQWAALVWEEEGTYQAVMPLPYLRKWGICYLRQPLFCQQAGIFSREPLPPATLAYFLHTAMQHFRLCAGYHFHCGQTIAGTMPGYWETHITHKLNLSADADWRAAYRRDRRYRLRQAEAYGQVIVESADIEPLIAMFHSETASRISGGVAASAYPILRQLFEALQQRNMAVLQYTLGAEDKPEAGVLLMRWQQQAIYLFNAASAEGRKREGRTLMIDRFLASGNRDNPFVFDFESAQAASVADFYSSFGAAEAPFSVWYFNRLPWIIRQLWQFKKSLARMFTR